VRLGNINSSLIDRLIQRVYNGDVSKVPTIDYLGPKPKALPKLTGFAKVQSVSEITYTLGDNLPDRSAWLQTLAGTQPELAEGAADHTFQWITPVVH
jgi:fatty acid synthase subunit alpha